MTRSILNVALAGFVLATLSAAPSNADPQHTTSAAAPAKPGLKLENLLKAELEGVDGTEVIVSRVVIPPHTSLPKHWHPGEEFAYVLEGSVTLWQEGKDDIVGTEGDVMKISLKQVHTAITTDVGATILVFRVHEQGQPERIPVE